MSGSQIQQAKYTASIGGKGLLPHWPVGNHSLLFTLFTNLVHCTIRMRHPSPETTMSTPASHPPPTRSREGTGQKGEEETETHEDVCGGNGSRSLQRKLIEASASTG